MSLENSEVVNEQLHETALVLANAAELTSAVIKRVAGNDISTAINGSTGLGGGVCQISSTVYNAVKNAGLTVIQRNPHRRFGAGVFLHLRRAEQRSARHRSGSKGGH